MISPKTMESRHSTMIRLDKSIHEQLGKIAKEEGRSVNQQIVYYIRKGIEREKKTSAREAG